MTSIQSWLKLTAAVIVLTCLACGGGYSTTPNAPPDFAPANGYRYHHPTDHVLLIYDEPIGVYRVSGRPRWYYSGGHYYRVRGNTWYSAPHLHSQWTQVNTSSLPSGLREKYKEKYVREHHRSHYASGSGSRG